MHAHNQVPPGETPPKTLLATPLRYARPLCGMRNRDLETSHSRYVVLYDKYDIKKYVEQRLLRHKEYVEQQLHKCGRHVVLYDKYDIKSMSKNGYVSATVRERSFSVGVSYLQLTRCTTPGGEAVHCEIVVPLVAPGMCYSPPFVTCNFFCQIQKNAT